MSENPKTKNTVDFTYSNIPSKLSYFKNLLNASYPLNTKETKRRAFFTLDAPLPIIYY